MKRKRWIPLGIGIAAASFALATTGKVLAAGSAGELAKILEAGLEGFQVYLNWLLEVLKVIW
jgi:hypothetical protein